MIILYKILRNFSVGNQFLKRSHSGDDLIVTLGDKPKEKIFV